MAASTVTVRSGDIFWQQGRSGAAEGYGEETRMPGTVCSVAGGHARVLRAGSRPERRLGALTAGRPDDDRHLQRRRDDTGDVAAALTADGDAHDGSVTSRNTPSGESRSTRRSPSAIGSSGGLGGGVMSPFTVSRSSPGG